VSVVGDKTDAEIVAASLEDGAAFGEIYERHQGALYKYVARRIGTSDAGDLVAETFTVAYTRRHAFDLERTTIRPWLYGIAANMVRDHLRRRGRASRAYLRYALDADVTTRSPESAAEAQLRWEAVNRALAKLNERDREALLMSALGGLEYAEIAEALNLKLGTVKSSINRARRKIGELVDTDRPITSWGSDERGDTQ
jgi:RNA polymerase sigma factor (sigma-70 family)